MALADVRTLTYGSRNKILHRKHSAPIIEMARNKPAPWPSRNRHEFCSAYAAEAAASLLIPFHTQKRNVRTVTISRVPPTILVIIGHALLGEGHHLLEGA